jgi:hypothetical protein
LEVVVLGNAIMSGLERLITRKLIFLFVDLPAQFIEAGSMLLPTYTVAIRNFGKYHANTLELFI